MKNLIPLICFFLAGNVLSAAERPNIIWIFAEDTSPWMGCYGHVANQSATPHDLPPGQHICSC